MVHLARAKAGARFKPEEVGYVLAYLICQGVEIVAQHLKSGELPHLLTGAVYG